MHRESPHASTGEGTFVVLSAMVVFFVIGHCQESRHSQYASREMNRSSHQTPAFAITLSSLSSSSSRFAHINNKVLNEEPNPASTLSSLSTTHSQYSSSPHQLHTYFCMTAAHPYQHILNDCLTIIFEYYIQDAYHNLDYYSEEEFPKELAFFTRYIRCWKFGRQVNVKEFLKRTRGTKLSLYYVEAESNATIDSETFQYFRGIHELHIPSTINHHDISDEDFANLRGIHKLNILQCKHISDAAFVHLRGIHTLNMSYCSGITDAAFVNLRGIHTLNMYDCNGITDAAMANLRGIHTLNMSQCSQITDAALENLRDIHTLEMRKCRGITDAGLENLRGIHTLNVSFTSISDSGLVHLRGIISLHANGCAGITDVGLVNLRGVRTLLLGSQKISDTGYQNLRGVQTLSIDAYQFSEKDLRNLRGTLKLTIRDVKQDTIQDMHFEDLRSLESLDIYCHSQRPQHFFSKSAQLNLRGLKQLNVLSGDWDLDDSHVSTLPTGVKDVSLFTCKISSASLHVFCRTQTLMITELHVDEEDVDHAKHCLSPLSMIRTKFVGTGAYELVLYLYSRCSVMED